MVERLSTEALHKLIEGRFEDTATCIVKFYANNCHYCHSLKDYYEDIANQYDEGENLHFFALNIEDDLSIEGRLGFHGVPSIVMIKNGDKRLSIQHLQDPDPPNKMTWFYTNDIKEFVEKGKNE